MKTLVSLIALAAGIAVAVPVVGTASAANASQGLNTQSPAMVRPAGAQLETIAIELADTTMRVFLEGVRQKDFRVLGQVASLNFRKSYTPAQVNDAFKQFFAVTVTGDPLAGKSPIFVASPLINTAGALEVQGFYELPDGLLMFQLVHVREGTGWKLDGINVRSEPYTPPAANPASGAKPLKFKIPAGRMVEA
ncbi:MAG: hypothetical protein R3D57_00215 [Hyphomicrobiaceae bacterium]